MTYSVLVVDPPWAYGSESNGSTANGTAESQYKTLGNNGKEINRRTGAGVEAIIDSVPMKEWAAANSHLYLWTTNPKLPFAFAVMKAWGFEYKTTLTWVKTRKDGGVSEGGMGWFFRGATEHVLFGVKGHKPIPPAVRRPNVVLAPTNGHSVKPVEFYAALDTLYGTDEKKIDVFARTKRAGWDAFGDEVAQQEDIFSAADSRTEDR